MRISIGILVSVILVIGTAFAEPPGPSTAVICVSDNFDRPGPDLGSDWTTQNWPGDPYGPGSLTITLNEIVANTNAPNPTYGVAYFNAAHWGANQYSQVTLDNLSTWAGPAVRVSNAGYYMVLANATSYYVRFRTAVNGYEQFTDLAANVPNTFSSGDAVKLWVTGNVLKVYQNGVLIGTYTDTNNFLTSGSPGMFAWNAGVPATLSAWSACSN
jgi:hypothetical protein